MSTTASTSQSAGGLDPAALLSFLDGDHAAVRSRVRELLARPEFAPVGALPREEYREKVFEWTKAIAAEGGSTLGFPPEFGGEGDVGGSIAAFETMALGDLSLLVKTGVQFGLFGGAVLQLGTRPHHERYLADIAALRLPGCFAMTETGHGSDVQSLGTTATYDADAGEFVISTPDDHARKEYIGNAARDGRLAAVFAQLIVAGEGHGVHCLLVPLRDEEGRTLPGVRIEDCGEKLGLNGVDNGLIWFDDVRVPREALLDRFAQVTPDGRYESPIENPNKRFFTMLGTLIQGRVSVAAAGTTGARKALAIAIRYGLRRRQFKAPNGEEIVVLDYLTQQRRLMPALAKSYALYFAQQELIAEYHRSQTEPDYPEEDQRKLESFAAGLKAQATWHATATIQACREACGGAGYMSVNQLAALKADTDVFTTFEGDNTVLLQLVGKSLLTNYRDHFGELDPLGMVGFVAGQVWEQVVERTAVRELVGRVRDDLTRDREGDDSLVRHRAYQLELFRWREDHIVTSVARRLKRGVDDGYDPFEVFIAVQDHVVSAANAHIDRIVLEAFAAAVDRCEESEHGAALNRLCDLYALSVIEHERGWYQEHGRMSSPRAKAVTREVNSLCRELRAQAGALVDAFGIPDAVLAAPIALREGGPAGD